MREQQPSSIKLAIANSRELIEHFRDRWTDEELERHLRYLSSAERNLQLWEER